jgi:hypothetical protein
MDPLVAETRCWYCAYDMSTPAFFPWRVMTCGSVAARSSTSLNLFLASCTCHVDFIWKILDRLDRNVKAAAPRVPIFRGYLADTESMVRIFKEELGMTPTQVRKLNKL